MARKGRGAGGVEVRDNSGPKGSWGNEGLGFGAQFNPAAGGRHTQAGIAEPGPWETEQDIKTK